MKWIILSVVLIVMAMSVERALADSGGAGVPMGQEYKRFGKFVTWSE